MALRVKKMKIEDLIPAEYNPRNMDDETFQKLQQSIKEFGYVEPIVWNERTRNVVGGNQRLEALKELGYKEVDVVVVDLPEEKEKALNVALNRITGEWDWVKLSNLLQELTEVNLAELTGFSSDEIETLIEDYQPIEPENIANDIIEEEEKTIEVIVSVREDDDIEKLLLFLANNGYKYEVKE